MRHLSYWIVAGSAVAGLGFIAYTVITAPDLGNWRLALAVIIAALFGGVIGGSFQQMRIERLQLDYEQNYQKAPLRMVRKATEARIEGDYLLVYYEGRLTWTKFRIAEEGDVIQFQESGNLSWVDICGLSVARALIRVDSEPQALQCMNKWLVLMHQKQEIPRL